MIMMIEGSEQMTVMRVGPDLIHISHKLGGVSEHAYLLGPMSLELVLWLETCQQRLDAPTDVAQNLEDGHNRSMHTNQEYREMVGRCNEAGYRGYKPPLMFESGQ